MPYRVKFKTRQFSRVMKSKEKAVDKVASLAVKEAAKDVYSQIFKNWPVDTWWSRANHHVVVNRAGSMPLEPPQRPDQAGALESKAFINRAEQMQKITGSKNVHNIIIGNTVPYSPDVPGGGGKIYAQSADEATRGVSATIARIARRI